MEARRKGPGRPPHERDEKLARQIKVLVGLGTLELDIARLIGLSLPTIRKYYRPELELGAIEANTKVVQSLFKMATHPSKPSAAAAIFWCKVRLLWRERDRLPPEEELGKKEAAETLARAADRGTEWEKLLRPSASVAVAHGDQTR